MQLFLAARRALWEILEENNKSLVMVDKFIIDDAAKRLLCDADARSYFYVPGMRWVFFGDKLGEAVSKVIFRAFALRAVL